MKRPSFQFYPGDWSTDLALRRCSPAARGVWMDVLCAFHNSDDDYGMLRWPLKEIANTIGASLAHLRELADKNVLKGSDTEITVPLVYVPRHGRKDGEPVTLIATQPGPLWFSKRLVKDEYIRTIRGESTRFGADDGDAPKAAQNPAPKPPFGDGTSSSSSSSSSSSPSVKTPPTPKGVRFSEFWETWPQSSRKVAKVECEKRWKARGLDADADAILAHVAAMKPTKSWQEGYEPAPLTYLNQRRWEDGGEGVAVGGEQRQFV